jgi:hypothetical protein
MKIKILSSESQNSIEGLHQIVWVEFIWSSLSGRDPGHPDGSRWLPVARFISFIAKATAAYFDHLDPAVDAFGGAEP